MSSSPSPPRRFVKTNGIYQIEGRPRETVKVIAHERPSNIPGKSLIVLLISQAPNGASVPHTHGGAAVLGLMINGTILNQMNTDPPLVCRGGDAWYECPGCHHVRGENTSMDESASFYAVFVVDDDVVKDGYEGLTVVDEEVRLHADG